MGSNRKTSGPATRKKRGGDGSDGTPLATTATPPASTTTSKRFSSTSISNYGMQDTVNPDKAVARLLYAILKQKNLKSIDWNQVARDPVLLEEISNGHAARMRYTRFRATVEKEQTKAAAAGKQGPGSGSGPGLGRMKVEAKDDANATGTALATTRLAWSKATKNRQNSVKRSRDEEDEDGGDGSATEYVDEDSTTLLGAVPTMDAAGHVSGRDSMPPVDQPVAKRAGTKKRKSCETRPDGRDADVETTEDMANTSFTSSLPSPPVESVAAMESLEHLEPLGSLATMRTERVLPQPAVARPRISSYPPFPQQVSQQAFVYQQAPQHQQQQSHLSPMHLGSAVMMRHHSGGSSVSDMATTPQLQQLQQFQQQCRQFHAQPSLASAGGPAAGPDAFDFAFATATTAAVAARHYAERQAGGSSSTKDGANSMNSASSASSPWMATMPTPYTSPHLADTFDMAPYAGLGGTSAAHAPASLFALAEGPTQQQQQQHQALLEQATATFMAPAFGKTGYN